MIRLNRMSGKYKAQAGISLVELMIAMALGLVLLAGVWQIFTSSSQAYRLTDSLASLQENMRFSIGRLQYETRMAGYRGCLINPPVNNLDPTDAVYAANPFVYDNRPIIGWEASGTGVGAEYTVSDFNAANASLETNSTGEALHDELDGLVLPGSDVFVLNNSRPSGLVLAGNPSPPANTLNTDGSVDIPQKEVLLVVSNDCADGDIFQKVNTGAASLTKGAATGFSPGNQNPSGGFSRDYDNDATVYRYSSTAFFVAEGVNGGPSLYMRRLDPGDTLGNLELVEGVENMQVLYGVAGVTPGAASTYVTADNVTDWQSVVSVRVALLMRSDDGVIELEDETADGLVREFNILGTEVSTAEDLRARLLGTITIGIRNRLN